jgi:hypothetical protein
LLATLRASGDLGFPSDHGEKRLLRMLFVSPSTLALLWFRGVIIQAKTGKTVLRGEIGKIS